MNFLSIGELREQAQNNQDRGLMLLVTPNHGILNATWHDAWLGALALKDGSGVVLVSDIGAATRGYYMERTKPDDAPAPK